MGFAFVFRKASPNLAAAKAATAAGTGARAAAKDPSTTTTTTARVASGAAGAAVFSSCSGTFAKAVLGRGARLAKAAGPGGRTEARVGRVQVARKLQRGCCPLGNLVGLALHKHRL